MCQFIIFVCVQDIVSCYDFITVYCIIICFFFFKQKTAYEMRISDWSSDVCSSDLDTVSLAEGWMLVRWQGVPPGADASRFIRDVRTVSLDALEGDRKSVV